MNYYYIITFLLFVSCMQEKKDFAKKEFYTQDSVYTVGLTIPIELDSFYTWLDSDDNACSDERKYRFSNSSFPIHKESGFFYLSYPDSSYRLTLKHVEDYDCKLSMDYEDKSTLNTYTSALKKRAEEFKEPFELYFSKEMEINKRNYLIVAYKTNEIPKQRYPSTILKARTFVDSNLFVFTYECAAKNCDDYIDRVNESLETIEIKKNKKKSTGTNITNLSKSIDLKNWEKTTAINGRLATEKDMEAGLAVFCINDKGIDIDHKPYNLPLPKLAYLINTDTKKKELVVVIQIESSSEGIVAGYKNVEGGDGACFLNELELLDEKTSKIISGN